jgi:NADH:ubiquinone oxidoreductase subunit K
MGVWDLDIIDIDSLYNKNKIKMTMSAEVPIEVYNLTLALFDKAYYHGLQGLGLEEYIGALVIAGICITTDRKKWEEIIPVYEEGLYDYL